MNIVYKLPVLGWMVHDAIEGAPDARYFFVANIVLILFWGVVTIGYPLVITLALAGAALGLLTIITIASLDTIERHRSRLARHFGDRREHMKAD